RRKAQHLLLLRISPAWNKNNFPNACRNVGANTAMKGQDQLHGLAQRETTEASNVLVI
ncbi:hypothetical protein HAX54_017967, partial [Datura stramonium]|nr:hypothetical protein [Datura stramonium]